MLEIQAVILAIIIIALFLKFRLGLSLYLAYFLLVPIRWTYFGGFYISEILINIILLLALFIDSQKNKTAADKSNLRILLPIFILYCYYLVALSFTNRMSFSVSFRHWYDDVLQIFVLPFAVLFASRYDEKIFKSCKVVLSVTFIVIFVYGISLLFMSDINPYVLLMAKEHNLDIQMSQFDISGRDDIDIRISSVFAHPMTYGLYLGMMVIYYVIMYFQSNNKFYSIGAIAAVVAIFTCGVRTPIAAIAVTGLVFLLYQRNFKLAIQASIIVAVGYLLLSQIPSVSRIVDSIINNENYSGGSSLEMRYDQFMGCIDEISTNPLFGNGYGWTNEYINKYRMHPVCYTFESLIFVLLCNYGVLGLAMFAVCIRKTFKSIKIFTDNRLYIGTIALVPVYYLAYSLITGEYGYMQYCLLFLSIICIQFNNSYSTDKY